MSLQRANKHFGIPLKDWERTGAFNPVIGVDSLFFLDPLRLESCAVPEFAGALTKVRAYFRQTVTLLQSGNAIARKKAISRLTLKELRGVGMGYSDRSDDGSAIGPGLAAQLATTATALIQMGIVDPSIFEIMGLFEDNFGPDRLSDIVISILADEVYQYTGRVADDLGIERPYEVEGTDVRLPKHPLDDKPLVLLPIALLRDLPVATSFEEIEAAAQFNADLRTRFNLLLEDCFDGKRKPEKSEAREALVDSRDRLATVLDAYLSATPESYDFEGDPKGLDRWLEKAKEVAADTPLSFPATPTLPEVQEVVGEIISAFKNFVENKGGWRGMYNDQMQALNERHARLLFYAIALEYQGTSNVDISPESNAGYGPVDFKLSRGSKEKVVVEVKLSKGKVRQGYEKQTKLYQNSEDAKFSYFVVLQVTEKSKALDDIVKQAAKDDRDGVDHPVVVRIDSRPRPSASKA